MKSLFYSCTLLLLYFVAVGDRADAATYHVKKTSTNTNNCLLAQGSSGNGPVNTFKAGIQCMVGGDTLQLMADGAGGTATYEEDLYGQGVVPPSGTPGARTTIRTYGSDTIVFGLNATLNFYTGNFSYVDFIGGCTTGINRTCKMVWDGGSTPGATGPTGTGLSFNNHSTPAHHLIFDGVRITGWGWADVANGLLSSSGNGVQSGGHDNIWKNCRGDHNGHELSNEFPGYAMYISGTNLTIENCEFDNNGNYGVHFYTQDPPGDHTISSGLIIRHNIFHDNGRHVTPAQASGHLLVGVTTGARVYGNLIYNGSFPVQYGIRVDYDATGTLVYNNTIYGPTYAGIGLADAASGAHDTILTNNITPNFSPGTATNTIYTQNLCSSPGLGCAYSEPTSTTFNAPGSDFSLKIGSLAINNGAIGITIGVTIPACTPSITQGCYNGTAPDIGALETGVPTSGGPPLLTVNLATVAAGASILLTVDDNDVSERVENNLDWVGSYVPGTAAPAALDWFYMNGTKVNPVTAISDAVIAFTAPLTPGDYEFRFYANGSGAEIDRLAMVTFTVVTPGIVMKFNISALKIGPSVTLKIGTP